MRDVTAYWAQVVGGLLLLVLFVAPNLSAQTTSETQKGRASLRGRVVDARTGEAIAKVKVIAGEEQASTDDKGEFSLLNLPSGQVDLYITTVNYGLVKKSITLKEGENSELQIVLNEDAAALTESVSVTVDPFEGTETNAGSEQRLNKRELQALSNILINDPIRAAQALPGAANTDDYRSEFSVRGAAFDRVGLYVDGVLTENFVHTIQGGYLDTGSVSVINADTVSTVSLFGGAFPVKYGYRSAATLDVTTRDGNRLKPTGRLTAALSGVAGVVDGPFANKRGAYLFAVRKSYVGYLVRALNDRNHFTNNPPILDLVDFQGKGIYDVTKKNQIGFSLIYGGLDFDRNRDRESLFENAVFRGTTRNLLLNGHWSYTPNPQVFWQTRAFGLRTTFNNLNRDEAVLDKGHRTQYGVRSDINFQLRREHRVEAGLYVRRIGIDSLSQSFFFADVFASLRFQQHGVEQAYYAQDTWTNERHGFSLTGGARVEHSGLTNQTFLSPRGALGWAIDKNWQVRLAAGRYYQFPDLELMFGRLGNPNLQAERSTQYNASVERLFGGRMRVLAEVYDREEAGLFFSLFEPRLEGGRVTFAEFPFQNSLRGHARGVELTLQRRSANKLAGWVSYAYSRTRLADSQTGLQFVSDTDQRHTVNVFGNYRFTETWNLSGEWRYGSGQPIPGFFQSEGSGYLLSAERNLARVPDYSRVDVRLSKAFLFRRWKLTVTGEVINLFNQNNVRYAGFDGFAVNGQVFGKLDRLLPILPSGGVVIEF
ncbi:MAG TPA: TonB-dependent receptor [Pyrinomonadaceae bacterium]|nr:TonB-dependent receptor [Pyrinomonadaceae bacterium]